MNTKHHTSLKIAKQLAEAGIVIESEFVWVCDPKLENWHTVHKLKMKKGKWPDCFPIHAPIATELLERLPAKIERFGKDCTLAMDKTDYVEYKYSAGYDDEENWPIMFELAETLPNALALLLIRLTKDRLI